MYCTIAHNMLIFGRDNLIRCEKKRVRSLNDEALAVGVRIGCHIFVARHWLDYLLI